MKASAFTAYTCTAPPPVAAGVRWHLNVKSSPHSFDPVAGAAAVVGPKCTPTRPSYAPTQKPLESPLSYSPLGKSATQRGGWPARCWLVLHTVDVSAPFALRTSKRSACPGLAPPTSANGQRTSRSCTFSLSDTCWTLAGPSRRSQHTSVRSHEPESTTCGMSAETATHDTASLCSPMRPSWPLLRSKARTARSAPPETTRSPDGASATDIAGLAWV